MEDLSPLPSTVLSELMISDDTLLSVISPTASESETECGMPMDTNPPLQQEALGFQNYSATRPIGVPTKVLSGIGNVKKVFYN